MGYEVGDLGSGEVTFTQDRRMTTSFLIISVYLFEGGTFLKRHFSLLPPCVTQGLNSSYQTWQWATPPAEPFAGLDEHL